MYNRQLTYQIGNLYDCPANWSWNVDDMQDYDLWLVCAGKGRLVGEEMNCELSGGDGFIFKPGARFHAWHDPDSPLQVVAAHFMTGSDSRPELAEAEPRLLYRRLTKPELTVGLLRLAINHAQLHRPEMADFWISATVEAFFESADKQSTLDTGRLPQLDTLCAEITRQPEKNWTVEMIAGRLHYSADHCRRLFLRHIGVAPIEYVIRRRVDKACFLLQHTNLSLAEISGQLNYQTIYYFSRQFKQIAGMPPSLYRKKS